MYIRIPESQYSSSVSKVWMEKRQADLLDIVTGVGELLKFMEWNTLQFFTGHILSSVTTSPVNIHH